jgi:hypothetical protein
MVTTLSSWTPDRNLRASSTDRSTARYKLRVGHRNKPCRLRKPHCRRNRSNFLRPCNRSKHPRWPSPGSPGGSRHGTLTRPPCPGVPAVPSGCEVAPACVRAVDGCPCLAANKLAVDERCAAARSDYVSAWPANARDRANLAGAADPRSTTGDDPSIAPLVSSRGKRPALTLGPLRNARQFRLPSGLGASPDRPSEAGTVTPLPHNRFNRRPAADPLM